MPLPDFHRVFLGFRPDPVTRDRLARLGASVGQAERPVPPGYLHLTLCVVAETARRDPFLAARIDAALAGVPWSCVPVRMGRVEAGPRGAAIHRLGGQAELQDFYDRLIARLAGRGIRPLHRRAGLRPHVTLGHAPVSRRRFVAPCRWVPGELLLIESAVGLGRHDIVASWPLLPSPQAVLPLDLPVMRHAAWRAANRPPPGAP